MNELKECPFCQGKVVWCDSIPDDDGDIHECDHLICTKCNMDFCAVGEDAFNCSTIHESKELTKQKFNTRG